MAHLKLNSTALYLAISTRNGSAVRLPQLTKQISKILYLQEDNDNSDGLILEGEDLLCGGSAFLVGYSGDIIAESEIVCDTTTTTILAEGWRLVSNKQDLTVLAQHEITKIRDLQFSFTSPVLLRHTAMQAEEFQGIIKVETLKRFLRRLGTRAVTLFHGDVKIEAPSLLVQVAKLDNFYYYRDYVMEIRYPANAELVSLNLDHTHIIGLDGSILGGNAENTRLLHWKGAIGTHVIFLRSIQNSIIAPGNEIVIRNDRKYRLPSKVVVATPFKRMPNKEREDCYSSHILYEDVIDNTRLFRTLLDLIPIVLLLENWEQENVALRAFYKYNKFSHRYLNIVVNDLSLQHERVYSLLILTLRLLLPMEAQAGWMTPNTPPNELVIRFVRLIHSLSKYLTTQELSHLAKKFYRHSLITLRLDDKIRERSQLFFNLLRHKKSCISRSRCVADSEKYAEPDTHEERFVTYLLSNSQHIRPHFEIVILRGENNILYRDTLYYMTHVDEEDADNRFEIALDVYQKMQLYDGSAEAFSKLIAPVQRFMDRLISIDISNGGGACFLISNNLSGLRRQFFYLMFMFEREKRVAIFVQLSILYVHLYTHMRLLPLTQLEDRWLQALYTQSQQLYLLAATKLVELETAQLLDYTPNAYALLDAIGYYDIGQYKHDVVARLDGKLTPQGVLEKASKPLIY
jgi:hypothetical protein